MREEPAADSRTDRPGRVHALDGLRGLAATAVIFYHAILHNDLSLVDRVLLAPIQAAGSVRDFATKIALIASNGEVAVFVFFVLSGCVLRLSLSRLGGLPALPLSLGFAVNRVARLYPPVIACMTAMFVVGRLGVPGYPGFSWSALIQNATLWAVPMHNPSLTVRAELLAVPFILGAWLLRRRFGPMALIVATSYAALATENTAFVAYIPNMHAYLVPFMVGMLVAEPALSAPLRGVPSATWWAALVLLVLCRSFHPTVSIAAMLVMVGAAGVVVAGLLHGNPTGSLHRFLLRPTIQLVGRVSFSLYLLNVMVLDLIWSVTDRWAWPHAHALECGLVVGLLAFSATLPLAWASERWVERPSAALGHRLAGAIYAFGVRRTPASLSAGRAARAANPSPAREHPPDRARLHRG